MKALISSGLSFGLCCFAGYSFAGSSTANLGSSMTTGPSSSSFSLSAAQSNPAMGALVVRDDENWRLSYFPNFSVNVELGEIDNFSDDLDDLIDIIDDPGSTTDSSEVVLERFNTVLAQMGESGYLKQSTSLSLPLLPLFYKSDFIGGTLGIGLGVQTQIGLRVLDDTLSFDEQNGTFSTGTALYIKSGIQTSFDVSYSRPIAVNHALFEDKGALYGGVKLKVIQLELSKQVLPIQELDGEAVEDVIEDQYDKNLESSTNIGIDVGLVWDADQYRAGLTFENINSPEFDYGTIGENCADILENTSARSSCESAAFFVQQQGDLRSRETHTKHALIRVDGLYKVTQRWQAMSSLDLAGYDDITGFENQWFHVATSYTSSSNIFPGARIGYQKNMTGRKTESLNFGLSLFKYFHLDFEYGLEKVVVDGNELPRRLGFSFTVEENF